MPKFLVSGVGRGLGGEGGNKRSKQANYSTGQDVNKNKFCIVIKTHDTKFNIYLARNESLDRNMILTNGVPQ